MIAFDVAEHEIHNVFLCGSENFDIFGGTIIFSIWSTNTDKSMSFRVTNLFFSPPGKQIYFHKYAIPWSGLDRNQDG